MPRIDPDAVACTGVALLVGAAIVLHFAPAVRAHGIGEHASTAVVGEEQLALPDLPVRDRFGVQGGFRSRLPSEMPVILSFTYTECETLCNIANAVLSVVDSDLGPAGPNRDVAIVTLAIDAERDTPQALDRAAAELSASDGWLWLTGGPRGTAPLLDALRFPPGALEAHDPLFLVGRPCSGRFVRVVGLPSAETLIDLARSRPPCGD